MYLPQDATEMSSPADDSADRSLELRLLKLKRECQFSDFLHQELRACRTETERGVVLSALARSRTRALQIAKGLQRLEGKPRASFVAETGASQ